MSKLLLIFAPFLLYAQVTSIPGGSGGGGGGDTTAVTKLGSGAEICVPSTNVDCRSLLADPGAVIVQNTNEINIGSDGTLIRTYVNAAGAPTGACVSGAVEGADTTNHRPYECLNSVWVRLPTYDEVALASHAHAGEDITSGTVATARLGSGTANSSTYLRGDQTWATPSGGAGAVLQQYGGSFTNSGATIAATVYSLPQRVPAACTIGGWSIGIPKADTGTATVKFVRVAAGTGSPGSGDEINTSGVALSTGTFVYSTTVTDFTDTTLDAGDIVAVALTVVGGTPTGLTAKIYCQE